MTGRSRVVFARGAPFVLLVACSTREVAPLDSGEPDATDDATSCPFCFDGSLFSDAPAPVGPPDALPPPAVACADAGDGGALCPLPPSICADNHWLEYFDNGTCIDGGCSFDIAFHDCGWGCFDGGCLPYSGTAPTHAP